MKTIIYLLNNKKTKIHHNKDNMLTVVGARAIDARNNNAECAVLFDNYTRILAKEKYFSHLSHVLLPCKIRSLLFGLIYGFRYLIDGRLKITEIVKSEIYTGHQQKYLSLRVNPKKNRTTQRDFYPPNWSSLDLLKKIDQHHLNYVLLRWPQSVINGEPMSDVDILIADDDAPRLRQLLSNHLGTQAIDIHTVHGGEPGRGDNMAYFPPAIGMKILERKCELTINGGQTPCLEDQFRTLAYHAVFNKGAESGLSVDAGGLSKGKIASELTRLKKLTQIEAGTSLPELLTYLKSQNWIPPLDMIVRKSHKNKWLKDAFDLESDLAAGLNKSYFALLIREIIDDWGVLDDFKNTIESDGFSILADIELSEQQRNIAASDLRGGNWSAGLWPLSGGLPYRLILVSDDAPIKPNRKQKKTAPAVHNARIFAKRQWREKFNNERPESQRANIIHASDSNQETIEYLKLLAPEWVDKLD